MIRHTVVFKLKHAANSPEETTFFQEVRKLGAIPTVNKLECLRQTSRKNIYEYGLSMEFADPQGYQTYNEHPVHVAFVRDQWMTGVGDFMEIDYEPMSL